MYEYKCKILKVIDGDTVDIDIDLGFDVVLTNQRVRMFGIDTPESRTRDKEEKKFGLLSKKYVLDRLPKGSYQTLKTEIDRDGDDARGKFGRILGSFIVYDSVDDRQSSINEMMIRDGYAVAYHGQNKDDILAEHMSNRDKLKAAGVI